MYVPNYIPQPLEVPGNVTEQPYCARLKFIRQVAILHLASFAIIAAIAYAPLPPVPVPDSMLAFGICILVLSIVRITFRRSRVEAAISTSFLPILLVVSGLFCRGLEQSGGPPWPMAVGALCAVLYALFCGRDFSFVGQYFLSLIVSSIAVSGLCRLYEVQPGKAEIALLVNTAYLSYLVYDSASLLARRRLGDQLAAVVDLYRDVFNIFGYVPRVVSHWRKHRIWAR
jgi:hypothetical protein